MAGVDPGQRKITALLEAGDFTAMLVTVSVGTLALSAALIKNLEPGGVIWPLIVAWCALLVSIVCGVFAMLEQVGLLSSTDSPEVSSLLEILNLFQLLTLLAGIGFLAGFTLSNVHERHEPPSFALVRTSSGAVSCGKLRQDEGLLVVVDDSGVSHRLNRGVADIQVVDGGCPHHLLHPNPQSRPSKESQK